jgi:hypothetical protein
MYNALPTLLATLGTLPAIAVAHDAFVGPDQAFLQHGLDGPIKDLQALIDVRGRMHTREHATFTISRKPWRRRSAMRSAVMCLSPVATMVSAALPVAAQYGLALKMPPWDAR